MIGSAKTYAQGPNDGSGNNLVNNGEVLYLRLVSYVFFHKFLFPKVLKFFIQDLLAAVGRVRAAIEPPVEPDFPAPPSPPPPHVDEGPPQCPPPPQEASPPRVPPPLEV